MQWHFPIVSTYIWWNVISWNMYFDRRLTSLVAALLWRPTPHMVTVLYSLLDCRGGARSIWRRSAGRRWRQSWPVQTSSAEDSSPPPVTLSTEVLITHECLAKENTKPDLIYTFLVAIILPYRNRESHMRVFLRHIHPILMRQDILYRLFTCFFLAFCRSRDLSDSYKSLFGQDIRDISRWRPCIQQSDAVQCGLHGGHAGLRLGLSRSVSVSHCD